MNMTQHPKTYSRDFLWENPGHGQRPFRVELRQTVSVNVKEPYWHPEHIRAYIELIIPRRGVYHCEINKNALRVQPGQVAIVQPYERHEDFYKPESELLFMQYFVSGMLEDSTFIRIFRENDVNAQRVVEIPTESRAACVLDLIDAYRQDSAVARVALEKTCELFFWELINLIPEARLNAGFIEAIGENATIKRVNDYFETRLSGKLNVEKLATDLGMSRRAFEKKFFKWFGDSPSSAFLRLKARTAASMISSGLSVKETADRLGYNDQFYFSTMFKRVMGFAPSELKK